ncbi:macrophage migration inhibitory factor-like protein [Dinothrombium tinctorium]|uniref:L-dopachrome isomerase n=1 Tax=Dinothrombium tinctorium TaxID=1965070 RepID=A0A443QHQ5_9ACAR|nr:macrophage migration inhibitory factor-like protein [Dinothrombium tinctorium]
MPNFELTTNLGKDKIPPNFANETVDLLASLLGKPKNYVVVTVRTDAIMSWGGSNEPAAIASVSSIGKINKAANKKYSAALFEHVEKNLGIKGERMYIVFKDDNPENVGYAGNTFA